MKDLAEFVSFLADVMTIIASAIAIYLFVAKREVISAALKVLLSYSTQLTLAELRAKLDQLNDYRVDSDHDEIVNVLHDIAGQLRGNPRLSPYFGEIIDRISKVTVGKNKLTEPHKRSIVSEIRERVRHADILTIEEISGDKK